MSLLRWDGSDTYQATRKAKSFVNEQTGVLSKAYESFPEPIESGFDVHIYFLQVSLRSLLEVLGPSKLTGN